MKRILLATLLTLIPSCLAGDVTSSDESALAAAPGPAGPTYTCAVGGAACSAACAPVSAKGCTLDLLASAGVNNPARQCIFANGAPQIVCYYQCPGQVLPDRELVGCMIGAAPQPVGTDSLEP